MILNIWPLSKASRSKKSFKGLNESNLTCSYRNYNNQKYNKRCNKNTVIQISNSTMRVMDNKKWVSKFEMIQK